MTYSQSEPGNILRENDFGTIAGMGSVSIGAGVDGAMQRYDELVEVASFGTEDRCLGLVEEGLNYRQLSVFAG
ncbi:hypothetical protein VX037_18695 [Gordonia sp. Z-3]|uniref:hypothetical protein n=1 Tax=Gordonia sp. Z-3 TaxID=3115408 RepID=UPI002E2DF5B3|nr:hypothetical protein [Gordonia sp. Z-3]MED5803057.1 hypothetical protein [Gordonia sp. Z-3]